jgi:Cu(I)/Ag(I) efflux system membrane protein CusA/SilA
MIPLIIRASITNRLLVIVLAIMLAVAGVWAIRSTPVDAIPDLSDVQVIIKTPYPGQAPQVVEDQVTFPITTAMLAVPGATDVRGFSFFGDSFVYIVFEDGTDLYWARSRVLEYLQQIAADLPEGVSPELGPDATGVGWIYQYALIDRTGGHDLAQLRTLQDWFLKFELQTVPGVSEVATIGGMVKQYQVVVDPNKLRAYDLSLSRIRAAIEAANRETGGSVIEMGEAEYMVRSTGYVDELADLAAWAMWPKSGLGRKCAAGLASSAARAMPSVAWSSCGGVGMHWQRSRPSKHASKNCEAACPRAWKLSRPTIAQESLSGRLRP